MSETIDESARVCLWCGGPTGLADGENGPCASCGTQLDKTLSDATTIGELADKIPANGSLILQIIVLGDGSRGARVVYRVDGEEPRDDVFVRWMP